MKLTVIVAALAIGGSALADTTRPTTRPVEAPNPDMMLRQLLSPARPSAKPLEPVQYPQEDQTSKTAVAPKTETQNLVREGSYVIRRVGRLTRTAEGQFDFTYDADGAALKDPPMIILPNLKLTQMEMAVKTNSRDLKFLISGMVTEYNGRNYILLEEVLVVQDETLPNSKKADERDNPIRP
ncbi:MAG TPA: hypothetical protein VGQ99_22420 [Tepidisphaeraceae bacterium]|jgi:hypothetical protein|nr:hypothetical protein [Tepidisphaeraceae bacterium]